MPFQKRGNLFPLSRIGRSPMLFEGGDHGLREFNAEVNSMAKNWLDKYVKNSAPLPVLEIHGK
ncbi:MAG TPA: hypothetical protein ENJ95_20950 [Bacteroidetes bacterium]|nr:hypothetical protein [Bacteroidota bacterium]